ncbi:hypothetical protein LDK13_07815 [Fusobacterium animalis]|uniref:hypothetical protein n=1 Tax=Fusobacterium animalis TaxID=76859 RepID=UPI000A916A1A|nr:hypothetical protein [Fusobacterium animalis]
MSDYTKHLRLIKPAGNEYYNVDHFNHNAELIDKETEDLSNKVAKIQEGATRKKAGIVQFGTEEGKALEGMMLARLAGCVGYGGDIQEPGVKDINYIYYDRNTRKMYKCINQNSDISANVANFIPLDNNSLLERLENLKRNEYQIMYNNGSPVPVGTSGKLPDYVTYSNILGYYFKIRFFGGVSFFVAFDNSTNTNMANYTLFNDIKFQLDINTNILKLVADPNREFISLSVFNKLT